METKIAHSVHELFGHECVVNLSRPEAAFGDYSTNIAMQLAKPLQQPPREIAEKLAEKLRTSDMFSDVSVAGPGFINLRVTAKSLADQLDADWSEKYGENSDGAGKTVVVEYPSPNMAKPYSTGHLRPGNQGWAAKRLMEVTGWNVITDNHLGDYGAPFGTWVVGFLRHSSNEQLEASGVYELGRIYIVMKAELKAEKENGDTALADEVQSWLLKLENNDEQAISYSQRFNSISLEHIHEMMTRLQISTDYEYGEAFFAPIGKQTVQKLCTDGIALQNDDGSIIVPLDDQGIKTPLLVQKSNGAALYATTDLATILFREETWQPDKVIYAVGAEQQFYFQQLAGLAKKLGLKTELFHLWFGVIDQLNEDGGREKMSSRTGVVLIEELLDKAELEARKLVGVKDISDEDVGIIALGAVKFSDFVADRRTNILFDWTTIFALSGFSGPYIQYAAVRIAKIIADAGEMSVEKDEYDYESEKAILLKLTEYPEVIARAARDIEPHKVATYLYELARGMNRYYETIRILDGDDAVAKSARIELLRKVHQVFVHALSILGIRVPSRM